MQSNISSSGRAVAYPRGVLTGEAERVRVLMALRALEAELRYRGVRALRVFGSIARGEADRTSDIDLLAEIDRLSVAKFSLG